MAIEVTPVSLINSRREMLVLSFFIIFKLSVLKGIVWN